MNRQCLTKKNCCLNKHAYDIESETTSFPVLFCSPQFSEQHKRLRSGGFSLSICDVYCRQYQEWKRAKGSEEGEIHTQWHDHMASSACKQGAGGQHTHTNTPTGGGGGGGVVTSLSTYDVTSCVHSWLMTSATAAGFEICRVSGFLLFSVSRN